MTVTNLGTFTTTQGFTCNFIAVPTNPDGTAPEIVVDPSTGGTVTVGTVGPTGAYPVTITNLTGTMVVTIEGDSIPDEEFTIVTNPAPAETFTVDPTQITFGA
jgi:hypothetical protein